MVDNSLERITVGDESLGLELDKPPRSVVYGILAGFLLIGSICYAVLSNPSAGANNQIAITPVEEAEYSGYLPSDFHYDPNECTE
jgi:hypothetical protein